MLNRIICIVGALALSGCMFRTQHIVKEVGNCTAPGSSFFGLSGQCRVIAEDGRHYTVEAPVIPGDVFYVVK